MNFPFPFPFSYQPGLHCIDQLDCSKHFSFHSTHLCTVVVVPSMTLGVSFLTWPIPICVAVDFFQTRLVHLQSLCV